MDHVQPVTSREPYPGPRPFEREHQPVFFGRSTEASELISLTIAHPIVLLYAQSGAGKTSLINANLVPALEEQGCELLGSVRIGGDIPRHVDPSRIANIFTFNALASLHGHETDPRNLLDTTLRRHLKARARPEGRGRMGIRILIFDQFEEIITSHSERWQDRAGFFEDLGLAFDDDPGLRVVLAMREEYLASLDPYARVLPEALRTRFRLERLREPQALEAIRRPLADTNRSFAAGAAEALVAALLQVPIKSPDGAVDMSGEFVEAVQLQVVCQNIWRSLPAEKTVIEKSDIQELGDVDQALAGYYERSLDEVRAATGISEGVLRRWFDKQLITPAGTRSTVYQDETTTGGLPNPVVKEIERRYLIRPEMRGGLPWYELAHDRFVVPIQQSNQRWRLRRSDAGVPWEKSAKKWTAASSSDRPQYMLLGPDLREAEAWIKTPEAAEVGVSTVLQDFLVASRTASDRARLVRRVYLTLLIVLIPLTGAIVAAAGYRRNAEIQKRAKVTEQQSHIAIQDTMYDERVRLARELMKQDGNELLAVRLALRAAVGRARRQNHPLPSDVETLRGALGAAGDALPLDHMPEGASDPSFSPNGDWVLGYGRNALTVWSATDGRPVFENQAADIELKQVRFTEDGKRLLALVVQAGEKRRLIREQRSWKFFDFLPKKSIPLGATLSLALNLAFSDDGSRLLVLSRGAAGLQVLDGQTFRPLFEGNLLKGRLWSAILSPKGSRLVVTDEQGRTTLWNTVNGRQVRVIGRKGLPSIEFAKGAPLVMTFADGALDVRDVETGQIVYDLGQIPGFDEVTFTESGSGLVLWPNIEKNSLVVEVHDAVRKRKVATRTCPDVERLFVVGDNMVFERETGGRKSFFAWNATKDSERPLLTNLPRGTRLVAWTRDLRRLLTFGESHTPRIWDLSTPPSTIAGVPLGSLREIACRRLAKETDYDTLKADNVCP